MTFLPQNNSSNIIQVNGVVPSVAAYVVQQLTKTVTDMAATGVTGVVIAFEQAQAEIRIIRREVQAEYRISLRERVYLRFSDAMNRAENNSQLRLEIKQKLLKDLEGDLDDIIAQIKDELMKFNRF